MYKERKYSMGMIVESFLAENPKKKNYGNYKIKGKSLVYEAQTKGEIETNEIARKIVDKKGNTIYLANSSILPLVGRTVNYGKYRNNYSETEIQKNMAISSVFTPIPFNVFEEAKLDINKFEIVEKGAEETLKVKEKGTWENDYKDIVVSRHFTGASLFKIGKVHYLFDIDRQEIKHKIFNAFLVKLKGTHTTITDAYHSLKPKAVLDAEKKGLEVKRQGEWFFIPCKKPKIKKLTENEKLLALSFDTWEFQSSLAKNLGFSPKEAKKYSKKAEKLSKIIPKQGQLQAGGNSPNTVEQYLKVGKQIYCNGKVEHSGREHKDLLLTSWHTALPNTSIGSFTITGDID